MSLDQYVTLTVALDGGADFDRVQLCRALVAEVRRRATRTVEGGA